MKTPLKLTTAQVAAEIAKRNVAFKHANPAQKRVLLAQDVIDQIKIGRYQAERGCWTKLIESDDMERSIEDGTSIQKAMLDGTVETCEVCALGGLIASCVLFKNKVTGSDVQDHALDFARMSDYGLGNRDKIITEDVGLRKHFTMGQLKLIELAFEGERGWFGDDLRADDGDVDVTKLKPEVKRALKWFDRHSGDAKRLLAIMKNIVKNRGVFVP